jgi:protein-S-isoprenylcysteine O-methyltransferase Ste14
MAGPLVYQHGPAATAAGFAVGVWLTFELVMNVRQQLRKKGPVARDPTAFVLVACIGGSVAAARLLGRAGLLLWPGGRAWPVVAGIALIGIGIGLRAWSIATLGHFFQYQIQVQAGHRVVTGGPYRYVRHPSYSGIALVLAGIAVASGDVLSLAAVALLGGAGLAVRMRAEERQLAHALGADYERFAAQRKRLIPGIW